MQEIFKFEDNKRNTIIKLLKVTNSYVLEAQVGEETYVVTEDKDIDHMASEYTTFIMGYVIRLKRDGIEI